MFPTWVGVVIALSLGIIALAALVQGAAIIASAMGVPAAVKALRNFTGPAITAVRQLIASIKIEAAAIVRASRDVRHRIVKAAHAAQDTLTSLAALAELM